MNPTTATPEPPLPDLSSAPAAEAGSFEPFPIHFFAPTTVRVSDLNAFSLAYGEEIVITPAMRALSEDRNGDSWLDLLDNHEAQIARFGRVRFARGHWPEGLSKVEPGTPEEEIQKARAWQELWNLPTAEARNARRAELRAQYGNPPPMNRATSYEPGDDER